MKKALLLILILFFSFSFALGQKTKKNKLSYRDFSQTILEYKIFSANTDKLKHADKDGYDVDYLLDLFFNSYVNRDGVFLISDLGKDVFLKRYKKNKYLKSKGQIFKNIVIEDNTVNDIKLLGRNTHNNNKIISYFIINTPEFEGYIYQTISVDGVNWQSPTVAIKHNKIKMFGWDIVESLTRKRLGLGAILTDKDNNIYVSHSADKGKSWSHPAMINDKLKGVNFNTSMHNNNLAVIFRNMAPYYNSKEGDVLLWLGKLNHAMKNKLDGSLIKIAENSAVNERWRVNHISGKDVFIIKSSRTKEGNVIEGFLLPINALR